MVYYQKKRGAGVRACLNVFNPSVDLVHVFPVTAMYDLYISTNISILVDRS